MNQDQRRGIFIPFELVVWAAFAAGLWLLRPELSRLLGSDASAFRVLEIFAGLSCSFGLFVFAYEQPREAGESFDTGWMLLVTLVIVPVVGWAIIQPNWVEVALGGLATWAVFLITRPRHVLALRRGRWLSRQILGFVVLLLIAAGSAIVTGIVVFAFWESGQLAESVGLPYWLGIIVVLLICSAALGLVSRRLEAHR